MIKLKVCPFCGKAPSAFIDNNRQDRFVVECGYCGAEKRSEYSAEDAAERWNERHFDDEDIKCLQKHS